MLLQSVWPTLPSWILATTLTRGIDYNILSHVHLIMRLSHSLIIGQCVMHCAVQSVCPLVIVRAVELCMKSHRKLRLVHYFIARACNWQCRFKFRTLMLKIVVQVTNLRHEMYHYCWTVGKIVFKFNGIMLMPTRYTNFGALIKMGHISRRI